MSAVSSTFLSILLYALIEERHFTLVVGFARFQPGLALNRQGQDLSPIQPSLRSLTAIKIPFIRTPSPTGSGMPNHYVGDLLHTIEISGLSRVSVWACGPLNLMKISSSKCRIGQARSGEIEFALEKLRLSACLIRSVRG
jgi:hypothetical protein